MDAFRGKRITVVGLGTLGRGAGDIRFLAEQGADLTVTDLKSASELEDSLALLAPFPNIRYTLGEHRLEDFENRDLIVNGPAVPLDSPYIVHARTLGIPITMSTALFARLARDRGATIVGVTGTRGKSTVTHLVAEILMHAGKQVLVGGNVRGVSTLALLPQVTKDTYCVLELDSWQLQGFRDEQLSPDIGVFTTFYPDHLNYYHNELDLYLRDKAALFLNHREADTLVLGAQAAPTVIETYGDAILSRMVVADTDVLPEDWELSVPGEHNRYNAALALAAVRALGISDADSKEAIEAFRGVPGRLELVREVDGVKIYNDTNATTPEATMVALKALGAPGRMNIVLIMGGSDKGLDVDALLDMVPDYTHYVSLLAGSGTERVRGVLFEATVHTTLKDAVADAWIHVQPGDALLFSPAFASFGMFKNEYDRGDQFNEIVRAL